MKYLNDKNYKWLSGDKTIDFNGYIDKYTCINCTSINKVTHIPIDYPDADDTEIIELIDNNVLDNFNKGHNNMILYKTINTIIWGVVFIFLTVFAFFVFQIVNTNLLLDETNKNTLAFDATDTLQDIEQA